MGLSTVSGPDLAATAEAPAALPGLGDEFVGEAEGEGRIVGS